jgi:hypothetical protein
MDDLLVILLLFSLFALSFAIAHGLDRLVEK